MNHRLRATLAGAHRRVFAVAALLLLTACSGNPFAGRGDTHDTADAAPKETPRSDFGSTIDDLSVLAAGSPVAWRAVPIGGAGAEFAAFRTSRTNVEPDVSLRVVTAEGRIDTVAGRIGRRWIDERQHDRYFGELSALFGRAVNGRVRDFDLDRWVENVHLSNRLTRRGAWSFVTDEMDGMTLSYVLTDGFQAFVATVDPDCADQVSKGPEVWYFGPTAETCGGVVPR